MSSVILCPRGHGPLNRFAPASNDGASIVVGGCKTCGGMWIPVWAIRSLLPEELPLAMAQVSLSDGAPRCRSCDQTPRMSQQHFGGVEVDRCLYCHSLWLDGGELGALHATVDEALGSPACDACGVRASREQLVQTGLGQLCRVCAAGSAMTSEQAPVHASGPPIAGSTAIDWEVDPRGGETLFEFVGAVPGSPVKGSITHENRFSRMMKAVGSTDIEAGHPRFDARFLVKATDEEPMRRWIASGRVADDLLILDAEGGCTVRVDGDRIEIRGSQAGSRPAPNPAVEQAASRVHQALLAIAAG
jgi:Zn-finger nucleic acid-binding protein